MVALERLLDSVRALVIDDVTRVCERFLAPWMVAHVTSRTYWLHAHVVALHAHVVVREGPLPGERALHCARASTRRTPQQFFF